MNINICCACLISLCLFSSCGAPSEKGKTTEEEQETVPVEWLTLQGAKEIHKGKKIVLVSGDEEYRSEEALPQIAKILSKHHGFDCVVLFAQDPAVPGIVDANYTGNIPGLENLQDADLMFLFTRFRNPPDEQMHHFENFLLAGKPIIAIRTATHAFNFKDTTHTWKHWGNYYKGEKEEWEGGFGLNILGVKWYNHHGHHKHQSTRGIFADGANGNALLNGIEDGSIWGPTDVYGMPLPMPGDATPLVLGRVINRPGDYDEADLFFGMKPTDNEIATADPDRNNGVDPNDPMMPIVWTKSYQLESGKKGQVFASTIGSSTDLMNEELRRLFVNASYDLLKLKVPGKAKVDIVGTYETTQFQFHDDEYWEKRNINIADLQQ